MKKIYKKINFVFLTAIVFMFSFLLSNKNSNELSFVETVQADAAPVFTAEQTAAWIGAGGDSGDGGDV